MMHEQLYKTSKKKIERMVNEAVKNAHRKRQRRIEMHGLFPEKVDSLSANDSVDDLLHTVAGICAIRADEKFDIFTSELENSQTEGDEE